MVGHRAALLLAIPSAAAGGLLVETMLFGDFFAGAIVVSPDNDTVAVVRDHAQGSALTMLQHGATNPALWAAVAGMVFAMWLYAGWPSRTAMFAGNPLHTLLKEKYFLDSFNDWFFAGGARRLGGALWKKMDAGLIDGFLSTARRGRWRRRRGRFAACKAGRYITTPF